MMEPEVKNVAVLSTARLSDVEALGAERLISPRFHHRTLATPIVAAFSLGGRVIARPARPQRPSRSAEGARWRPAWSWW